MRTTLLAAENLFSLDIPVWEVLVRGSLVYLGLLLLLRIVLRRQTASQGLGDMLFVVLVASAVEKAMQGEHASIPAGLLLAATLLGWNFLLDVVAARWPWLGGGPRPPVVVIEDGKIVEGNLRALFLDADEIEARVRLCGFESVAHIYRAYVEDEGHISVIPYPIYRSAPEVLQRLERIERLLAALAGPADADDRPDAITPP